MKADALSWLSLCRKAGKLKLGFDPTERSLGKEAVMVLYANDVSPKTRQRMQHKAAPFGIATRTLPHTADEIAQVVGKHTAVLAITDRGFAEQLASLTVKEEFDI